MAVPVHKNPFWFRFAPAEVADVTSVAEASAKIGIANVASKKVTNRLEGLQDVTSITKTVVRHVKFVIVIT